HVRHCFSLFHSRVFLLIFFFFFFNDPAPTEIYTLSLHDALPICWRSFVQFCDYRRATFRRLARIARLPAPNNATVEGSGIAVARSEEHTSELQSRENLVCRLLLEKKKKKERNQ